MNEYEDALKAQNAHEWSLALSRGISAIITILTLFTTVSIIFIVGLHSHALFYVTVVGLSLKVSASIAAYMIKDSASMSLEEAEAIIKRIEKTEDDENGA